MPTRISAGLGDHPCFLTFITMIPTDCKIIIFFSYLHIIYGYTVGFAELYSS